MNASAWRKLPIVLSAAIALTASAQAASAQTRHAERDAAPARSSIYGPSMQRPAQDANSTYPRKHDQPESKQKRSQTDAPADAYPLVGTAKRTLNKASGPLASARGSMQDERGNGTQTGGVEGMPDRRPIVTMFLRNGSPFDPEGLGRIGWWLEPAPIAIAELETRILDYGNVGARRFVLKLPAGSPPEERMAALQTQFLDVERRFLLSEMFARLKLRWPDIEFGLYAGFGIDTNPDTIQYEGEWRAPNLEDPDDRQVIVDQYRDAVDLGFDFLVLDAVSGIAGDGRALEWTRFLEDELGVEVIGEAFPLAPEAKITHEPSRPRIDSQTQIDNGKWMALVFFHQIDSLDLPSDGQHYIGLVGHRSGWSEGSDTHREAIIDHWIARGFIPYIYVAGDRYLNTVEYAVNRMAEEHAMQQSTIDAETFKRTGERERERRDRRRNMLVPYVR